LNHALEHAGALSNVALNQASLYQALAHLVQHQDKHLDKVPVQHKLEVMPLHLVREVDKARQQPGAILEVVLLQVAKEVELQAHKEMALQQDKELAQAALLLEAGVLLQEVKEVVQQVHKVMGLHLVKDKEVDQRAQMEAPQLLVDKVVVLLNLLEEGPHLAQGKEVGLQLQALREVRLDQQDKPLQHKLLQVLLLQVVPLPQDAKQVVSDRLQLVIVRSLSLTTCLYLLVALVSLIKLSRVMQVETIASVYKLIIISVYDGEIFSRYYANLI
jgi:hypothetical protein